jgi:hypothetical protein
MPRPLPRWVFDWWPTAPPADFRIDARNEKLCEKSLIGARKQSKLLRMGLIFGFRPYLEAASGPLGLAAMLLSASIAAAQNAPAPRIDGEGINMDAGGPSTATWTYRMPSACGR